MSGGGGVGLKWDILTLYIYTVVDSSDFFNLFCQNLEFFHEFNVEKMGD